MAVYSLGAKCISEFVASFFAIWLGESVIANELLGQTKGKGFGFGWIAYGFGLAFFFAILTLGYISAHVNPAMCLGLLVVGKISGLEFIALSLSEFAGMFVGAIFVFLHYLPHFKTVPEPMSSNESDNLLRTRDALNPDQLNFVSYNTRDDGRRQQNHDNPVISALQDVRYYLSPDLYQEHHIQLMDSVVGTKRTSEVAHDIEGAVVTEAKNPLRRRSIQVADLHRKLKNLHLEEDLVHLRQELREAKVKSSADLRALDHHSSHPSEKFLPSTGDLRALDQQSHGFQKPLLPSTSEDKLGHKFFGNGSPTLQPEHSEKDAQHEARKTQEEVVKTAKQKRIDTLYAAAIQADQNAKLSVFATRPAIPSPIFNWLAEFLGTAMLIGGAFLIDFQSELMYKEFLPVFGLFKAFYVGLMIQLIILGLGGPTGVAINPARDLSPRIAHQLLPISGKGSSEWFYAWVPFTASFCGGAVGAILAHAINTMNQSQVTGAFYELVRQEVP